MMAGSRVRPPQWPECTPPSRSDTTRSKCQVPRVPVAMVGTAGSTRGPSEAISASAASASLLAATNSRRPLLPRSSAVSSTTRMLAPRRAAALRQHRFERGEVERVLALVVGGAAAVPAVAFLRQAPGREAGAPLLVQAADRVAMAVEQDGRAGRVLDPLGGQDGAEALQRVRMDGDGEAHAFEPGADAVL